MTYTLARVIIKSEGQPLPPRAFPPIRVSRNKCGVLAKDVREQRIHARLQGQSDCMIKEIWDRIRSRSRSDAMNEPVRLAIGITTFEHRFERYFVPLLNRIREYDRETEVVVAVNGEHQQEFSEEYRSRILSFVSQQPKVFPVLFPNFRGLSKLWNTIIIHSSGDYVLMLNDDTMIRDSGFFHEVASAILKNEGHSFVINESWSHFLISRKEIDELGYFDERLLGIGEEDGDMIWRYLEGYGRSLKSIRLQGIVNFANETEHYRPANIKCRPGMKYSQFNREFMFNEKYQRDPAGMKGMFDEPVALKDPGKEQYPNERFYRKRKNEL